MFHFKDILIITWHGIHDLNIYPGLPDTGGQNIYVQNFAETIHDLYQCRVIILNRGGYPHPYTNILRDGIIKDPDRELYVYHIEDEVKTFLRKEYLTPALIEQASEVAIKIFPDNYNPDLIISNFWDGGVMGECLRKLISRTIPHVWIPHETVNIKQSLLSSDQLERHSIPIRMYNEAKIMEDVECAGATSRLIEDDFMKYYGGKYYNKIIPAFPGVDEKRFYYSNQKQISFARARQLEDILGVDSSCFLKPHISEFGRSDSLKRKEHAVEAFAKLAGNYKNLVMFMNLDQKMEQETSAKVHHIIEKYHLENRVVILSPYQLPQSGKGSDIMPEIIRTSEVFLSMSEMEGFGMAVCEAAASGVPIVGTDMIPVLTDTIAPNHGGFVADHGDIKRASRYIDNILNMNTSQYKQLSCNAYDSVIPKYTWSNLVAQFFNALKQRKILAD